MVEDRSAESSTTSGKQLWDIIIEAYERRNQENALASEKLSGIARMLLKVGVLVSCLAHSCLPAWIVCRSGQRQRKLTGL